MDGGRQVQERVSRDKNVVPIIMRDHREEWRDLVRNWQDEACLNHINQVERK